MTFCVSFNIRQMMIPLKSVTKYDMTSNELLANTTVRNRYTSWHLANNYKPLLFFHDASSLHCSDPGPFVPQLLMQPPLLLCVTQWDLCRYERGLRSRSPTLFHDILLYWGKYEIQYKYSHLRINSVVYYTCRPHDIHMKLLIQRRVRTKRFGNRSFWYLAPTACNSLPKELHDSSISLLSFKIMLKTHLFRS